jgi:hypothetical protein
MGISSDAWYHLRVSQKFSETWGIPQNGPDTYKWRDIEHQPYLYFWINGRVLNLNEVTFNFNETILLRVVNIFYSLGTLIGVYLLSKEIFKNKWLRLLPVFLLVNTIMFLFLSSAINYDNLANMFSVFSILFFVKSLSNRGNIKYPLMMLILLCLGTLTKYTVLPLAFILAILMIVDIFKNIKIWRSSLKSHYWYLLFPLIILGVMNLGVYGVNLVKFHSLTPDCLDVLTYDQCLENGVFVRDYVWIPPVDVNLFEMIISGERMDPIRYAGVWTYEMTMRVIGIMGDSSLFASIYIIPFYLLFLLGAIVMAIKYWKKSNVVIKYLSITTLFYLLVLMIVQHYNMYLQRNIPTLSLQGRYMFPVISSFYILCVYFLSKIQSKRVRNIVLILLAVLFVLGCFPFFFSNVDWNWFGSVEY